jgi:hypothetical protein
MTSHQEIEQAKQSLSAAISTRTEGAVDLDNALLALGTAVQAWREHSGAVRAALTVYLEHFAGTEESARMIDSVEGLATTEGRLAMTVTNGVLSAFNPDELRPGAPTAVALARQMGDSTLERIAQMRAATPVAQ